MTKQQKLCVGAGSAFGLCVLALGWFLYSAYAERKEIMEGGEETSEGLESAKGKYGDFFQKNPFPSTESVNLVKANEDAYAKWRAGAFEVVAKGDCLPAPSSLDSGTLKDMMRKQVTQMQKLSGTSKEGRICAGDFQFGFEPYLSAERKNEKSMPTEKTELLSLYAQFVTITNIVDMFHANGVLEIRKIERLKAQNDESDGKDNQRKKSGKGKGKGKGAEVVEGPTCYAFELEYLARPSAFVNVLNAFASSLRFYVVGDLSFGHEGESLKERLNRAKGSSASGGMKQEGRRRGSRIRTLDPQEEKQAEKDDGFVTRPDKEQPILVKMKLSVYDFGKGGASSQKEGN